MDLVDFAIDLCLELAKLIIRLCHAMLLLLAAADRP